MKITKNTIIAEVINQYPKAVDVFMGFGFFCFGCPRAQMETIEQGAKAHGFDDKQVTKMLTDLNKIASKEAKK
jgi:hybrid cluster-associated redox disulfide protein